MLRFLAICCVPFIWKNSCSDNCFFTIAAVLHLFQQIVSHSPDPINTGKCVKRFFHSNHHCWDFYPFAVFLSYERTHIFFDTMLQSSINEECGCSSFVTTACKGARALESWPCYCHCSKVMPSQDSTEVIATTGLVTLRVHDTAWWWVKASNLGSLSSPVVWFNLAHISSFFLFHRLLWCYSREYSEKLDSLIQATMLSLCVCMILLLVGWGFKPWGA